MITIGALFVVGGGLQATGAIEFLGRVLLGRPKQGTPLLRLIAPVAGLSSFMNNTPFVALFLPIFVHLAKKLGSRPRSFSSRFLRGGARRHLYAHRHEHELRDRSGMRPRTCPDWGCGSSPGSACRSRSSG